MGDFWIVIGLALLPALGNFSGALLAEFRDVSKRNLNRALHAAAGIVIAIVAVELVPRALQSTSGWIIGLSVGLGGLTYVGIENIVEYFQNRQGNSEGNTSMWMIYIAVAVDLFSDGLLIGTGSAVGTGLAIILAVGQVLADVPEGFATIANLKDKDISRKRRLLLGAALAVPVLVAASFSYLLLRGQSEALQMAVLVFTAGLLIVAAVEDMITEAHEIAEDKPSSVLAFIGGFVLFTFVSAGLGGGS